MLYNGFVVTDNRAFSDPNINPSEKWNPNILENGFNSKEESSVYDVPAGPGGGGSTPPTLPSGWSVTPKGATPTSGGKWQQYLNPETIGAAVGTIGAIAGAVGGMKNPDKQRIKAVCGRKPLFNTGGKKDRYNECVQNLLNPPVQREFTPPPPEGMSKTTKIVLIVSAVLLLIGIVVTVIIVNKNKRRA